MFRLAVFVSVLVSFFYVSPASAQEPPYYPLVCRFSDLRGQMHRNPDRVSFSSDPLPTVTIKSGPDGSLEMITLLQFRHGAHAAPAGLQPGECAWQDRPMNSSEPTSLVFVQSPPVWEYTTIRGSTYDGSGGEIVLMPAAAPWTRCLSANGYITLLARSVDNPDWGGHVLQGAPTNNHFTSGDCENVFAPPSP